RRGDRSGLAPDLVDQAVGRDDLVPMEKQRREEGPPLACPDVYRLPVPQDLQRAEHAELDHVQVGSNLTRPVSRVTTASVYRSLTAFDRVSTAAFDPSVNRRKEHGMDTHVKATAVSF